MLHVIALVFHLFCMASHEDAGHTHEEFHVSNRRVVAHRAR